MLLSDGLLRPVLLQGVPRERTVDRPLRLQERAPHRGLQPQLEEPGGQQAGRDGPQVKR